MEFNLCTLFPRPHIYVYLLHKLIKMLLILILERWQQNSATNESAASVDNE